MTRADFLLESLARLRLAADALGVSPWDISLDDLPDQAATALRLQAADDFRAIINDEVPERKPVSYTIMPVKEPTLSERIAKSKG
jgi:hypothetical protein